MRNKQSGCMSPPRHPIFRRLMQDRRFWGLPMCLETPKSKDLHEDAAALHLLRSFLRP